MPNYFIVWNADKSEGFITDSKADAESAISGRANYALGFPSQSTLGEHFYSTYGEEGGLPDIQEVKFSDG